MNNLYGLIGEKLSHSKSPEIHRLILNEMNIDGDYFLFEIKEKDLKKAIEGFKVLGFKGINVTIPHKIKIMELLDDISEEAINIGSINTIKFDNDKSIGINTDYFGFYELIKKNQIVVEGRRAVVLGTGGAAKTVIKCLKDLGAGEIVVVSRSKLEVEFEGAKLITYEELNSLGGNIIINCTPIGMSPNIENSPITKNIVMQYQTVIDLIYNPLETKLVKYAKELNIPAFNGLYMLVAQAVKAQEFWNGITLDINRIDEIYVKIHEDMFNACKKME